nr:hypothetical protein Itr_chr02CG11850 [Ipomoea trifida]
MPLSWSCYYVEDAMLESPHRRTRGRESERGSRWALPSLIAHTSRHHHRSSASNDANARETPPGFAAARGFVAEVQLLLRWYIATFALGTTSEKKEKALP